MHISIKFMINHNQYKLHVTFIFKIYWPEVRIYILRDHCGRDLMVVGYQYNKWLSPLQLWVESCSWRGVLDTTLCNKVCQWFAGGRCFSLGTPVSSTNKIKHNWNIVLSGVNHHSHNSPITLYILIISHVVGIPIIKWNIPLL